MIAADICRQCRSASASKSGVNAGAVIGQVYRLHFVGTISAVCPIEALTVETLERARRIAGRYGSKIAPGIFYQRALRRFYNGADNTKTRCR